MLYYVQTKRMGVPDIPAHGGARRMYKTSKGQQLTFDGFNCSAIESTHPRNCPIRFSESLIELASACVEVRWIVRLPPFLRSVSSDLKTHFSKNALRYYDTA